MCKLLDYGLELLDDEEGLNYALDEVGFDDDTEYSYTWELVSQLFEYPWIAVGDEYKLDGLKKVCLQRAEKAGFKNFEKVVKR